MTMTPEELGFPAKFAAYRPGQFDTVMTLASSDKRFSQLSANTGAGKSIIYTSLAMITDARTLVLTGTKGLQQQLVNDFGAIGLVDVRGRSNYRCPEYGTCDEPGKLECQCTLAEDRVCTYQVAVERAKSAKLVVTNFAYWMSLVKYSDPAALGQFDLLVIDEAHTAVDWLSDFVTVDLTKADVRNVNGRVDWPRGEDTIEQWTQWMRQFGRNTELHVDSIDDKREKARMLSQAKSLLEIADDIDATLEANSTGAGEQVNWVIETAVGGCSFTPVWAHKYAERLLFRGIPRVLLASATLSPSTGKYLGLPMDDSDYYEMDSGFDPARRPFIYVPTVRVQYDMSDGEVRQLVNRIDTIIDARLDRKGIIQARSYSRAMQIAALTRHKSVILTHDSRTTRDVIEMFKACDPPCVLISPAVEEGYDFPHDECRYQIIVKVPFVDGRAMAIKARAKSDPTYMDYLAVQSLVQQAGRGMRSADDVCECIILDDHWAWFSKKATFPKWFKRAWQRSTNVPPPLDMTNLPQRPKSGILTRSPDAAPAPPVRPQTHNPAVDFGSLFNK